MWLTLPFCLKHLLPTPILTAPPKAPSTWANVAQFYKFEPGTSLAGNLNANVSVKGKKSFIDKSKYDAIQTAGTVQATNVSYKSKDYPDGVNREKHAAYLQSKECNGKRYNR